MALATRHAYGVGDLAPLRGDRGHDDRRPGGGGEQWADQGRRAGRAPTGWPSTTSCCASKRSSATPPASWAGPRWRPGRRPRVRVAERRRAAPAPQPAGRLPLVAPRRDAAASSAPGAGTRRRRGAAPPARPEPDGAPAGPGAPAHPHDGHRLGRPGACSCSSPGSPASSLLSSSTPRSPPPTASYQMLRAPGRGARGRAEEPRHPERDRAHRPRAVRPGAARAGGLPGPAAQRAGDRHRRALRGRSGAGRPGRPRRAPPSSRRARPGAAPGGPSRAPHGGGPPTPAAGGRRRRRGLLAGSSGRSSSGVERRRARRAGRARRTPGRWRPSCGRPPAGDVHGRRAGAPTGRRW